MMRTQEKHLEALNASIEKSREEIDALAAALKKLPEEGGQGSTNGKWTALRQRLDEVGAQSGKVVKGLTSEIERHPLVGGIAAFGAGFTIATLLFKRGKGDSER
ncbi:MAG: hypothetical protein C4523_13030 [Myxococcales bacterium]|nr:MAG: hypothetical protein C4523_13030 [Myxococcales bacterium]